MAPLAGLGSLSSAPQETDMGVLEAHGGPVDTTHGYYGDRLGDTWPSGYGSGYHGTSYGYEVDQGEWPDFNQPGAKQDQTPTTHESPYPRGIIQPDLETPGSYALAAEQLRVQRSEVHSPDLGAPGYLNRNAPGGRQVPDHWTTDRYESPAETNLSASVPGQLRQGSNGVGLDVSQGYGRLNDTEEFQHGHSIRVIQHDSLAWDRSLTYAPPQPLYPRYPMTQATFDGPDSPYGVLGDTSTGQQVVWEGRIGNPTAYQQPPEPAMNQAVQSNDVWSWYG